MALLHTQRVSVTDGNPRFAGMLDSVNDRPSTGVSSDRVSRHLLDDGFGDVSALDRDADAEPPCETCPNRRLRAVMIGCQLVVAGDNRLPVELEDVLDDCRRPVSITVGQRACAGELGSVERSFVDVVVPMDSPLEQSLDSLSVGL